MRHACTLFLPLLLLAQTLPVRMIQAAEPSAAGPASGANAAVIYWQAFDALPVLEGDAKAEYEAALKSSPAPVAENLRPVLDRFDRALRELHRARGAAGCDWGLNYDDGPGMLLPHVQKARALGRAGSLRARLLFAENANDAAVADALAVTKMARDCGSDSLLVSLLVGIAIENTATDVLAANLMKLTPSQLDALAAAFKTLPKPVSLAECMQTESRVFGDWIERFVDAESAKAKDREAGVRVFDGLMEMFGAGCYGASDSAEVAKRRTAFESVTAADLRGSVRLLRADYAHVVRIASLDPADRRTRAREFEVRLDKMLASPTLEDAEHRFAKELGQVLPAVAKAAEREDRYNVRRQLFELAIDVQRRGPDAARAATVAGHGPVEYRKTDGGFELRCLPVGQEAPEILPVGAGEPGRP